MRLVLILGVVVAIGVLAAGSVAAALILRDTGRPPEATAQYIPADVDFYLYLDLDDVRGDLASQFLAPFRSEAFESVRDDFLGEIQKEIDLLEGSTSLIGADVTVALFAGENKSVEPDWAVFAQTKGRDAGGTFAERVRETLSEDQGVPFSQEAYLGADLFVVNDQEPALAVTDEYVIYGVNPARLKATIDNLATPPSNSLAKDEAFLKATASLPSDRSAFVFLRNDSPSLGEVFELATLGTVPLGEGSPEFAAASASFIERGVRLDLYMDPVEGGLIPTAENRLLSADRLPEDALMLVSFVGANEAWQQFRDSGGADDLFGQTNRAGEPEGLAAMIGLSALDSVMGTLTGEVALALLPSDIRIDSDGDFESGVINALLMAETADASGFEAILDIALGLFAPALSMMDPEGPQSFQPTQIDIGEYQAKSWDLSGLLGETINYEPGYLITEDMLVIGSTTDNLRDSNAALTGDTSSLRSNKTFSKALDLAPDPLQFLMYADIAGIVEMVENAMAPETLVEYTQQVKPIVAPFESLVVAGSSTAEAIRFTLAITIKE